MNKRQALATSALAALPTVMAAAQQAQVTMYTSSAAHVGYAIGLEGGYAIGWAITSAAACITLSPLVAIGCGIVAAF